MGNVRISVLGLGGRSVFMEVDHFHKDGETLHCTGMYCEPGGKGYNQAVAARRLGADVSFIGAMGEDADAVECESFLLREGISPHILRVPAAPTACAFILTDIAGENRVTVCRGAADELTAEFVLENESVIAESDVLLLNFEYPREANAAAMDLAAKHGVPTIINPAPMLSDCEQLLKKAYIITPNLQEAKQLLHLNDCVSRDGILDALRAEGYSRAAVTLGAAGVLIMDGKEWKLIHAKKNAAVDTTGAGDCFSAALTVCLAKRWPLDKAAEYASRAAGLSVEKKHIMPSLPYAAQLK